MALLQAVGGRVSYASVTTPGVEDAVVGSDRLIDWPTMPTME